MQIHELISFSRPEIFAIRSRRCPKFRRNFIVFGPPFFGRNPQISDIIY